MSKAFVKRAGKPKMYGGSQMQQINLTIYEPQVNFLKNYQVYGFQNQSSMIRAALNRLQEELELQNLVESNL